MRSIEKPYDELPLRDKLLKKIYAYYDTIWKDKWIENIDQEWLNNFSDGDETLLEKERINMLYLLSKFMYFGNAEMRELLTSLYRDLFKHPVISAIRKANNDTIDTQFIKSAFEEELETTRFLGVGNPSESGVHLLYYFRQECGLSKEYFISTSDIFRTTQVEDFDSNNNPRAYLRTELREKHIKRYIFIDDFCGSGTQASDYLKEFAENIKFENPDVEIKYLMLFATTNGLTKVREVQSIDSVESVFILDESFKAFSDDSRYFKVDTDAQINKGFAMDTASKYGRLLFGDPLGYKNCQLLLGLYHNTPDNTLPIFWQEAYWKPIFKRYNKIY